MVKEIHKQAELASTSSLFSEWSPNPIIGLDFSGKVIYSNLAARTQFPSLAVLENKHPILLALTEVFFEQFTNNQGEMVVFSHDVVYLNKIYEQDVFSTPGKDFIFIHMLDVTEKRFIEKKLQNMNIELESRIIERTKELNEAKENAEILAQKSLEASLAKSSFLSMMSHELRTPLNGIIGPVSLLINNTKLTNEQIEFINMIQESSNILLNVITNVLDYSDLESGRIKVDNDKFLLQELINNVMNETFAMLTDKSISVKFDIYSEMPKSFVGDAKKIHRVLTVLMSNAVKFTEKGEVKLNIKSGFQESNHTNIITVIFEIEDSGIGISDEIRKKLFQPFVQGDPTQMRKHGGTGLGLVIAKYLIDIMNGSISVKSEMGKGSVFSVALPLLKTE